MEIRYTIGASVSCFDLFNLEKQFEQIHEAPVDFLHYDVVDGNFNRCIILGLPLLAAIRPHTRLPIDVHLAAYQPERFIEQFAGAGADIISIHPEGTGDVAGLFEKIRKLNCTPALALRSETSAGESLLPVLEQALFVTKLTVNPGFSGQKMQSRALDKLRALRKLMDDNGVHTPIAADGNVNPATIPALIEAGASMFIGGSSGLFLKGRTVKESAELMLEAVRTQESGRTR
ncbi:MAG: ribulose-phosphate 3-epimerase [Treponema sp.]|jgi:ribulose-phosphate 3-epimerase|nr:ribulose-phosphate 3-epimerase [Treponema sp.]